MLGGCRVVGGRKYEGGSTNLGDATVYTNYI
jgi:hypothetical protein